MDGKWSRVLGRAVVGAVSMGGWWLLLAGSPLSFGTYVGTVVVLAFAPLAYFQLRDGEAYDLQAAYDDVGGLRVAGRLCGLVVVTAGVVLACTLALAWVIHAVYHPEFAPTVAWVMVPAFGLMFGFSLASIVPPNAYIRVWPAHTTDVEVRNRQFDALVALAGSALTAAFLSGFGGITRTYLPTVPLAAVLGALPAHVLFYRWIVVPDAALPAVGRRAGIASLLTGVVETVVLAPVAYVIYTYTLDRGGLTFAISILTFLVVVPACIHVGYVLETRFVSR